MALAATEVPQTFPNDPTDPNVVVVAMETTDVSLNFDILERRRIIPWAEARTGLEAVL